MSSTMIQPVRQRPPAPAAFIVMCLVMCIVMWMVAVSSALSAVAAEGLPVSPPSRSDKVRFADEIQPLLAANCTACHNAKNHEGGLMLDSLKGIVAGGDSGPGVVAGKPAESVLFLRAAHRQDDVMPPADNKVGAKHLSSDQLGLLERWIAEGATAVAAAVGKPIAWRPLPPPYKPEARARGIRVAKRPGREVARIPLLALRAWMGSGLGWGAARASRGRTGLFVVVGFGHRSFGRLLCRGRGLLTG